MQIESSTRIPRFWYHTGKPLLFLHKTSRAAEWKRVCRGETTCPQRIRSKSPTKALHLARKRHRQCWCQTPSSSFSLLKFLPLLLNSLPDLSLLPSLSLLLLSSSFPPHLNFETYSRSRRLSPPRFSIRTSCHRHPARRPRLGRKIHRRRCRCWILNCPFHVLLLQWLLGRFSKFLSS